VATFFPYPTDTCNPLCRNLPGLVPMSSKMVQKSAFRHQKSSCIQGCRDDFSCPLCNGVRVSLSMQKKPAGGAKSIRTTREVPASSYSTMTAGGGAGGRLPIAPERL
jgi:hypothetical protein